MKNIDFSLLFKVNLFLTGILYVLFLLHNESYTTFTFIVTFLGAFSSAIILYIAFYILLYIFSYKNKFILYVAGLLFFITNIALIVDFFIFRLYKFHINAMVINILTSPSAFDSIQTGVAPVVMFIVAVVSFLFLEIYIIKKLVSINNATKLYVNEKLNKLMIIPFFLIILSEKFIYGFSSLHAQNDILSKFKVIPLYQPLTFNRIASKYFDYKPVVQTKNTIKTKALVNYPIKNLEIKSDPNKINIFIFAVDSARNNIINDEVSPNVQMFKKDAITFNNHYSGGNATRFGIFSLMYGINSTYWFSFLNANKGSVLFDVLKKLDYKIDIISSTNTNWPEFKNTCYVNIQDSIKDDFEGEPWEKDAQSTKYFLEEIEKYDGKKPIFSFVFLDAPHGYSYPEEFNKFNSNGQEINYVTVSEDSEELDTVLKRYKNAVYYNDKLFADMIKKLKEKNLYDNSLIIYTSDHGQELYEYGFFSHNTAFSKAQINSPFIVKLPKDMQKEVDFNKTSVEYLTSHIDVVPTLLSLIGVKNASGDYSNGKNLFSKDYARDYIFTANWNNNAIVTDKYTYVFSNLPNKMFNNEVRLNKTYDKVTDTNVDAKLVLDVMNENRKFLK